jgi:transcriptional regulator with XRE-family HTH domain
MVGAQLEANRSRMGISAAEMADALCLRAAYYRKIETGTFKVSDHVRHATALMLAMHDTMWAKADILNVLRQSNAPAQF